MPDFSKLFLIAAICVASFIEFWAAVALCIKKDDGQLGANKDCDEEWAWAVAAGLIGVLTSVVLLILNKFKPDLLDGVVGWIMYFLLFGTWLCAVAVCTMQKPFAPQGGLYYSSDSYGYAGNGYFATWLALIFSTFLFFGHVAPVAAFCSKLFGNFDETKKVLFMILAASGLEMWHAARICDDVNKCAKMLAWAVSAGAMSAILILVFLLLLNFVAAVKNFTKYFAAFLALWWIAAVCTLTMPNSNSARDCDSDDPFCVGVFLTASNGFFGTWMAMLFSVVLACQQFGVEVPGFTKQEEGPTGASGAVPAESSAAHGSTSPPPPPSAAPAHVHTHEETHAKQPAAQPGITGVQTASDESITRA